MNKIEELLAHARANETQKFKDVFNSLRNSLNVWAKNGGSPSEATIYICGNLTERCDDLLTIMGYYWKSTITDDHLLDRPSDYTKAIFQTLPNVVGAVHQSYGWEKVLEVVNVFLKSIDNTNNSTVPQNLVTNVLFQALGKLRTNFVEQPVLFQKFIDIGKLKNEGLIPTAVTNGNDDLLSATIKLNGIEPAHAVYVASKWSEIVAEYMPVLNSEDPSIGSTRRKTTMRVFPIVSPYINVEDILDHAPVDNPHVNFGTLGDFVKRVKEWDGSKKISASVRELQQIDLILEHFDLPSATKHEDLLNKLVVLSGNQFAQAQNWRNIIGREKLLVEMGQTDQPQKVAIRKI